MHMLPRTHVPNGSYAIFVTASAMMSLSNEASDNCYLLIYSVSRYSGTSIENVIPTV